ncbi:MAG: hypothetical protein COA94_01145 [Rickettsiales bacterium]|nr:MAG: hypothetical protein COA94_01145 [Rickettsiales bacterium]
MSKQEISDYIRDAGFFKDLSKDQLAIITDISEIESYANSEVVFKEGEKSRDLFLIISGGVDLYKLSQHKYVFFTSLDTNNFIGEMAFVDGSPRSAKVISNNDTKLMKISYAFLEKNHPKLLNILMPKIARIIMERLRKSTSTHVQTIEKNLQQFKIQNEFGYFFIAIIMAFATSAFMNKILEHFNIYEPGYSTLLYSWAYLITVSAPFLALLCIFKYKLSTLGVTSKNLRVSLVESVIVGSIAILLLFGTFSVLGIEVDILGDVDYRENVSSTFFTLKLITYMIHSVLQEFVARGLLQHSIQRFLRDRRGIKSVLITSTLFGVGHLHITISVAAMTFAVSVLLGLLFLRHKNIWGISLVHFAMGVVGIVSGVI